MELSGIGGLVPCRVHSAQGIRRPSQATKATTTENLKDFMHLLHAIPLLPVILSGICQGTASMRFDQWFPR
jgi:hypothetical protein